MIHPKKAMPPSLYTEYNEKRFIFNSALVMHNPHAMWSTLASHYFAGIHVL